MVSLRTLFTSAAAMLAVPALAAITPEEMVTNINRLTEKSKALQAPAQSISLLNAPLIIIGQGPFPQLITGFTDIVSTATGAIAAMKDTAAITDVAPATAVANAFREFVHVHQALLNILIGKAGLITSIPFIGPPMAAVLRSVEAVVDSIAFGIIGTVEVAAQKTLIQSDANALDGTLTTCINKYSSLNLKRDAKVFVA
ncbi:hypothetical protein QBC42DRAFT_205529 [Cladorrhinum samala]|uniref:UVI-1 n=1 Tax=Cladorrhinum samala TaxID=585594 RepID=A0AAV9HKX4_9PEZI|nr:hypothetical protein QBC42DRAFT_205529 [Cladorrhinum samala]